MSGERITRNRESERERGENTRPLKNCICDSFVVVVLKLSLVELARCNLFPVRLMCVSLLAFACMLCAEERSTLSRYSNEEFFSSFFSSCKITNIKSVQNQTTTNSSAEARACVHYLYARSPSHNRWTYSNVRIVYTREICSSNAVPFWNQSDDVYSYKWKSRGKHSSLFVCWLVGTVRLGSVVRLVACAISM